MAGAWETEAEWQRLKRELDSWRTRRVHVDVLGQHRSQLGAAYTLVDRALAELRVPMAAMAGSAAQVAAQCRVHDRRLMWVRRLWDFFRERFDQRDDPALAVVLRGADEVVWSCHREPFASLPPAMSGSEGPPPLPYIEPSLTPEVFPHGLVPATLRRDIDAPFLRRALQQLPFAVVRVPASCRTAPWWLVHLGHEVGHVLDALLVGYPSRVALVQALDLDPRATDEWTRWSGETFADLYAVLMHGPWAVWALAAAERVDDDGLGERRDTYPPPAVRLLVMAHACESLGATTRDMQPDTAVWQARVDGDPALGAQLRDGCRVVDALLAHRIGGTTVTRLAAWDPAQWGRHALLPWTATLASRPATFTARGRRVWPRLLLAASVLRRKEGEATAARFDGTAIGDDLLTWLPAAREPGARPSHPDLTATMCTQAAALARDLMAAEPLP